MATSTATLRFDQFDLGFDQTIYLQDPYSELNMSGNAFRVSGRDIDLDGTPSEEERRLAVGTPGDPSFLIQGIAAHQRDNFVGRGRIPSMNTSPDLDIDALMTKLGASADRTLEPDSSLSGAISPNPRDHPRTRRRHDFGSQQGQRHPAGGR